MIIIFWVFFGLLMLAAISAVTVCASRPSDVYEPRYTTTKVVYVERYPD